MLQADWAWNGYGRIDHAMIVTKKDSGGIYLTYHSTNNKDKKFTDITQEYPNARFYGWRLY